MQVSQSEGLQHIKGKQKKTGGGTCSVPPLMAEEGNVMVILGPEILEGKAHQICMLIYFFTVMP